MHNDAKCLKSFEKGQNNCRANSESGLEPEKRRFSARPEDRPVCAINTRTSGSFPVFLGSGPGRGRSPVEWGDFPSVR